MKTLAICFTQDSAAEIKIDDTIIKMYQAQKAVEDRILNAEDPVEEEAKIEAEAEAALAKLEAEMAALSESLNKLNIALIMRDNCKNRMTLADLEKLSNTTSFEEDVDASEVPEKFRKLAEAAEADEEKNSH